MKNDELNTNIQELSLEDLDQVSGGDLFLDPYDIASALRGITLDRTAFNLSDLRVPQDTVFAPYKPYNPRNYVALPTDLYELVGKL